MIRGPIFSLMLEVSDCHYFVLSAINCLAYYVNFIIVLSAIHGFHHIFDKLYVICGFMVLN